MCCDFPHLQTTLESLSQTDNATLGCVTLTGHGDTRPSSQHLGVRGEIWKSGHPWLCVKFKASLGCVRTYLKNKGQQ